MSRFLGLTLFLVIVTGLVLHAGVELPWFLEWFGTLPGDIVIRKKHLVLYFPLASSFIVSIAFSMALSLFSTRIRN